MRKLESSVYARRRYENKVRTDPALLEAHRKRGRENWRKQQELKTAEADLNITKGKVAKLTADQQAARKAHARAADEMKGLQATRGQQEAGVQALVERCNKEEDRVFASFSKGLKLGSVREYEQNSLQQEKEKELQALELKTQFDKIGSKLKFEQKKDLKGAIQKLEAR